MSGPDLVLSVTDLVAFINQTLETAYPSVVIVGELSNFRVSKNRWIYFDLKDEHATMRFFGSVYMLPGPLEDGLMLQVRGTPRLHPLYGFSVTVANIPPAGEGSLKKAAALLQAKLQKEGLFDPARKRRLPYPPQCIGLITSGESAAYADFVKIINQRWSGLSITLLDVQVQGEPAPAQITQAVAHANSHAEPFDVLVITRGGGSAEDLAAFNTEQVTRAVAGSRIPTVVAIGHEVDTSLAELAANQRASTPSNAAELLVPDKQHELQQLTLQLSQLGQALRGQVSRSRQRLEQLTSRLRTGVVGQLQGAQHQLDLQKQLLEALNPQRILRQGYSLVTGEDGQLVRSARQLREGQTATLTLHDG